MTKDDFLSRMPRRLLIVIASTATTLAFLLIGYIALDAKSKVEAAVADAAEAKTAVAALTTTVTDIQNGLNRFNDKYDRNQEENQKVFRQILIEARK